MIVQHDAAPGKIAILVANKSRKRKGFQKEPCTKKPSAAYFGYLKIFQFICKNPEERTCSK